MKAERKCYIGILPDGRYLADHRSAVTTRCSKAARFFHTERKRDAAVKYFVEATAKQVASK